jgi:hypothetical protein
MLLCPAGLPTDNDLIFCKSNVSAACYFYRTAQVPYTTAKSNCQALGGDLVSWSSDEEQVGPAWLAGGLPLWLSVLRWHE